MVILDLEWKWLSSNNRAAAMLGYNEVEFSQKKLSEWFSDLDSESSEERIQDLNSGKSVPTFKSSVINLAGEKLPVEINMALVPDSHGDPLHIQLIFRDITARKLYEEFLIHQVQHDPLTNLPNRQMLEETGFWMFRENMMKIDRLQCYILILMILKWFAFMVTMPVMRS